MAETREDEGEAEVGRETGPAGEEQGGGAPKPTPEEIPELLGERTDYPFPFGEGDDEGAAERGERPGGGPPAERR
jgi:hypothetical protein